MKPQRERTGPSFAGLFPASASASTAARGASIKTNTRCELALRRELWQRGLRYRLHPPRLPGRPDIVFPRQRLAVFCDGDFWHGRNLEVRVAMLARGHNPTYWIAKVRRNVERDRQITLALVAAGWVVLRFWESEVLRETLRIAKEVAEILAKRDGRAYSRAARRVSTESRGRCI